METIEQRLKRVIEEEIAIVPYNPAWPLMFEEEKKHLLSCLPGHLVQRIEHFGSTAVPNISSKPIIDMLVEVESLEETKTIVPPILTQQGYEYFWRPTRGDDIPPFYAWFIKRNSEGKRTHHIHMVEANYEHWERLLFKEYLIAHPAIAKESEKLKLRLADEYRNDRVAYTNAKTEFIVKITKDAKAFYR